MRKRFLLSLFILILSISLSSCSLLDDFLNELSVESYSHSTVKTTVTSEDITESTTTSNDSSLDTSSTTYTQTTTVTYTVTTLDVDNEYCYGYLDLSNYDKKESLEGLYAYLYNELLKFSSDFSDVEAMIIDGTPTYKICEAEFYKQFGLNESEACVVLKLLELDYPEFYFISNEVRMSIKTINDIPDEKTLFVYTDPEYALGLDRKEYSKNIELFFDDFISEINDYDTELTIIRKAHDFIIDHAVYAFEIDGVTPSDAVNAHNIVGITSDGEGVCESYAALFTYVLNKLGIKCITVTGYGYTDSGYGGHAWNYVEIDGKYYGFDLTWDDSTESMQYFGFSAAGLRDHVPSYTMGIIDSRLEYLYILPDLSDTNLEY